MKLPSAVFAVLLASTLSSVVAAPIAAESRITAVTVYTDRAVVMRTASVQIGSTGVVELTVDRLPAGLQEESLQVAGRGTAQTTLLDVTARPVFVAYTPNERVKALEDEIQALTRQDRTLADRMAVVNQQRDYVLKIQSATTTPTKDGAAAASLADTWAKLLTFTEDQLGKFAAELQSVDRQREDLQARRTALEQQLNQLRGEQGLSYKTVTVRLDASSAGELELSLSYAVTGANWTPSYDARVRSGERTAAVSYFGVVRQNTGEDWKNVNLTLSTARPSLGGAAPELTPWVVQQQQIFPQAAAAQSEEMMTLTPFSVETKHSRGYAAADARADGVRQKIALSDMSTSNAVVETQATSATFRIATTCNVPSDHSPQKVPITTAQLAAAPEYTTTPKLVPSAFLTSKVTNSSEFPLLAGPMNVFLDDSFIAASSVRTVMPGEKFDLALGADEGVSVKRKLNNRFVEDTGLMNKGHRITYDVTTTVQNNKKTSEKIVVLDQLPVSRHEKIVVKLLTPDEKTTKPDAEGLLKWTLELKPGEKRELPLKFSVEYPNDFPVVGLE
jgi:uncharacterized protein (TIGR02231 family)